MTRTLYFIRHGETEWNAIRRMQGQWNADLNETGRAQAAGHGRLMEACRPEVIWCSPLDRTRQTAEIVNARLALPICYDDRLMEWNCGDWSGEMYADLPDKWPDEWAAWQADPFRNRAPGGEHYGDMFDRARPFLDELLDTPHRTIAIVSHGMIGKVMVAALTGLGEAEVLSVHQHNDVVFRVTLSGSAEVHHYKAGEGPLDGLFRKPTAGTQSA